MCPCGGLARSTARSRASVGRMRVAVTQSIVIPNSGGCLELLCIRMTGRRPELAISPRRHGDTEKTIAADSRGSKRRMELPKPESQLPDYPILAIANLFSVSPCLRGEAEVLSQRRAPGIDRAPTVDFPGRRLCTSAGCGPISDPSQSSKRSKRHLFREDSASVHQGA